MATPPAVQPRHAGSVGRTASLSRMMSLILAASLVGLAKTLLVTLVAVLNAVLALLAAIATWKTYLAIGAKVALIALFCVPVLGVLVFLVWGQRVVRNNQR